MGTSGFDWRPRRVASTPGRVSEADTRARSLRALTSVANVLSERPGIRTSALANACHLRSGPLVSLLGRDLASLTERHQTARSGKEYWTNDQMLAALKEAAGRVGGGNLPEARYSELAARNVGDFRAPHAQSIIRRFGTWNAALGAARITANEPLREYEHEWTRDSIVMTIAEFIAEFVTTSGSAYRGWATGRQDTPSVAAIQNIAPWAELAQDALLTLRTPAFASQWDVALRQAVAARTVELGLAE